MGITVTCQMVEFHRFGRSVGRPLSPDSRFIRTTGWDGFAEEVSPSMDHEDFLRAMQQLRYVGSSERRVETSRQHLAAEARRFLPVVCPRPGELLQVDVVTNAAELWAIPFEACFDGTSWLEDGGKGVVVTRRIRGEFSSQRTLWPTTPKILFAHAPAADDLDPCLIAEHASVLRAALIPWAGPRPDEKHLVIRTIDSVAALEDAARDVRATFVHILAHGARAHPDPDLPQKEQWGLRLGPPNEAGALPNDIAAALTAGPLPYVVTVAACDSGNQVDPVFAPASVVQELHRRGVPVVVGSQLPLTKAGSSVLAGAFYEPLCCGQDVRVALHAARVALKRASDTGHDWLSLVGYVRLPPEGYGDHLIEVALRAELGMLRGLQARIDETLRDPAASESQFDGLEALVRARRRSLQQRRDQLGNRKDLLDESRGLEASACKRLAEFLFHRGQRFATDREARWQASRAALDESRSLYSEAYAANLHNHWLGVQELSLEAALNGRVSREADLAMVRRAAELARDARVPEGWDADYWSSGTLIELALLDSMTGNGKLDEASQACTVFLDRVRAALLRDRKSALFALDSTCRQLRRYVDWWTTAHGFFPTRGDLSDRALVLLQPLEGALTAARAALVTE